ncbi:MAG: hypothetical protein U0324_23645 [Polyangiales bacterium]
MTWSERSLLALALIALPATAYAQGRDDDPTRRRLILEAGTLRDRGDHAAALERLREAAARRMTPSLRLFLAQEERAVGRYDDAVRDARTCAAEFEADRTLSHRGEFMASCRALADELALRVGQLMVRVPADARDATVTVRGETYPAERWGESWDVLPGELTVEATAPGREPFRRELTVRSGATAVVRVELPPRAAPPPRETPRDPPPDVPTEAPPSRFPAGPVALLGVGGAALVASAVFFALRGDALDARDALCGTPTGDCLVATPAAALEAAARQDDASTYNTLSAVSLGVGAAAAVAGTVWLLASRGSSAPARTAVSLGPGVLTLRHVW